MQTQLACARMSRDNVELVLRAYHSFVAGDLETVNGMLDPEIEWHGIDGEFWPADLSQVQDMLVDRLADGYRIELERCIGKGDKVLLSFVASGVQKDDSDDRPLQTRRYFMIGRYWGIATVREGSITRVQDYPNLGGALAALGVEEDAL